MIFVVTFYLLQGLGVVKARSHLPKGAEGATRQAHQQDSDKGKRKAKQKWAGERERKERLIASRVDASN